MPQNNAVQVFEGGWEQLENAVFTDNQTSISNLPESHFIRPNGRSVSVISGTAIETYPIGLPYYDPDQVGALIDTFTIPDDVTPIGHCWNDDGTELYVVGQNTKTLYQYTVPTPYTPSSIIAASVSLDLVDVTNPVLQGVISRDGDFIFITDGISVYSFPLPVKDDITSNSSNTVFTPGGGVNVDSFALKREGDKLYTGDIANNLITEYVTTAPNIIVGATPNGNTFTLPIVVPASGPLEPFSITFRSNGKQLFVLERTDSVFVRCHLDDFDRDWNISTASFFSNSFPAADSQSIFWKPDGTRFFSVVSAGGANDRIDQFTVPNRWNMTDAVLDDFFSLTGVAETPRGIWVTPDGLSTFIVDAATDTLYRFNMNTGWDISTMVDPDISFLLNGDVNVNNPSGIAFSKDQLRFYIPDAQTDDVFEFHVLVPLDIENAFHVNTLDLTAFGDLSEIRISPDDTLVYFSIRIVPDAILMFSLPPDGNISGAVFLQELDVEFLEGNLQSFFIRENDGKKLWVAGQTSGLISSLDMTLEFNNAIITNFGDELTTDIGEIIVYE